MLHAAQHDATALLMAIKERNFEVAHALAELDASQKPRHKVTHKLVYAERFFHSLGTEIDAYSYILHYVYAAAHTCTHADIDGIGQS